MKTIEHAKRLLESGDIAQARALLFDIAKSSPEDVSPWVLLCGISTRTQDWELGIISFSKLVELRPASSLASSGLVQSYFKLKKYDEAIKEIERFESEADPNAEEARLVMDEHRRVRDLIASETS